MVYSGEKTVTLYSKGVSFQRSNPGIETNKNLVWINSNHFVKRLGRQFTKGRPANIEKLVNEYDSLLMQNLANVIDLKIWEKKK